MDDIMVKADHVSMRFNLGIEKGFSLKQGFVDLFNPKKRREKKKNKINNEFWALSDVDFEIKRGEVVGLIGSNGAGKSTMLETSNAFPAIMMLKPTSGSVSAYGNICPMIELGAGFDFDLTARENVFLNGAVMGYSKAFIESKYDEIVEFSELQDFMEVPVRNFSSGMIARLAFSVATVVEPEILIVDEILSVGDLAFQQKSEEKMLSMIRGGTTVLYVSHSVNSIMKLCDRCVWLDHGKMREIGPAEEICYHYVDFVTPGEGEKLRKEREEQKRREAEERKKKMSSEGAV